MMTGEYYGERSGVAYCDIFETHLVTIARFTTPHTLPQKLKIPNAEHVNRISPES